jgi:Ala-tRNA(Pro) deacylase
LTVPNRSGRRQLSPEKKNEGEKIRRARPDQAVASDLPAVTTWVTRRFRAVPTSPEDLLAYLASLEIETSTVEHPPLHTVSESQSLRGEIPGGHTKNLFVKDKKDRLFLLVLGEETAVDLKRVHEKIGAQGRVSFGSPQLLEEIWGVRPGAVTPFGAINDEAGQVRVVLDEAMMRHGRLNFHPLVNTRTTGLASADLVKFLRATGHEPMVVALGQDGPPVE